MVLLMYYVNNDGDIVEGPNFLPSDTFEVTQSAAEASVGSSTITLTDKDALFYVRGHKLIYFVETDAADDELFGIIGPFYAGKRRWKRGPSERTGVARLLEIEIRDINTLLTRRVQRGSDAKRPAETDVERIDWLINTAEVIGGSGSAITIGDIAFVFSDSPTNMSESEYTGQDSAGVINDLLNQSGKNAFLFASPTAADEPERVGIWYGRTERTEFASIHKISNLLADISDDVIDGFATNAPDVDTPYVFPPSFDADLERDPERVISGAYVTYDGGYSYQTRPATATAFARRDMTFNAELVKSQAAADSRALRYLRDLRNEDDAITVSIIVPAKLVNGVRAGHRIQVKFQEFPGYAAEYVWMRVAHLTTRQLSADSPQAGGQWGLYELAMDLRAEEPPDSATTGDGLVACPDTTEAFTKYPFGDPGYVTGRPRRQHLLSQTGTRVAAGDHVPTTPSTAGTSRSSARVVRVRSTMLATAPRTGCVSWCPVTEP